jgi:hypothetical protein
MEISMPNIIQAVLVNFGTDIYIGDSVHDAMEAVKKACFEASIMRDGALVAWFSPISGWKFY